MTDASYKVKIKALKMVVVVPTYNNDKTLKLVLDSILEYTDDIIVVNDGSTDTTEALLQPYSSRLKVVGYVPNKGKGHALRIAFITAVAMGFDYALTIDSDGQHYAKDIMAFVDEIERNPDALVIGSRTMVQENKPEGNVFANKFSNFWFKVQTGINLSDTQSGYRIYPLKKMGNMKLFTKRYEAELELLVFAAWRGVELRSIPITVYYPPREERVSHFRPFQDFTRISILNTILVFLALGYGYPRIFLTKLFNKG